MKKIVIALLILICLFKAADSQNMLQKGPWGVPGQICDGVNIHFTTGHEKDLDMIAAAGFKFIRTDFVWQDIEHSKGIYDWSAYDELTDNLKKRGLSAIYILDYSNSLYEHEAEAKDPSSGVLHREIAAPFHPESVAAFAHWAAESADHFRQSDIIWEIWNEPNVVPYWMPAADVAGYSTLASATCKQVRAVVPNSVIIGPATSQIPFPFIESFLESGILEYIDAVSVHPYRDYSRPPESVIADYGKIKELIKKYKPQGKKTISIINSEWGYASATKGLTVETQAEYIVRMQLANVLAGIPVSIWYDWKNDGTDPGNFEHNCGTVTADLEPKLAYFAIKTMNDQLKGYTLSKRLATKSENDYLLLFSNSRDEYRIAAWTSDSLHNVSTDVRINNLSAASIKDGEGNSLKIKTDNNRLVLELRKLPQYLTLPRGTSIVSPTL